MEIFVDGATLLSVIKEEHLAFRAVGKQCGIKWPVNRMFYTFSFCCTEFNIKFMDMGSLSLTHTEAPYSAVLYTNPKLSI